MRIYYLHGVAALYTFVRSSDAGAIGKPLKRILHLLCRKQMVQTLFIEDGAHSKEYLAECETYGEKDITGCRRFHFFGEKIENEEKICAQNSSYFGYCDVRPDGSLAKALIADKVIIRPDTYTYLVCRVTENVSMPDGTTLCVVGFPHIEKDSGVVMCSQASVANVVSYWNFQRPNTFSATTALEISRRVGKTVETLQKGLPENGLSEPEIKSFFIQEGFNCYLKSFWELDLKARTEEDPSVLIYGYLESGFPVIAIVGTSECNDVPADDEPLHALTIVGHTFDKNIWTAHADPLYFSKPLSGIEAGKGGYYSNLAWIKYFIVQDDNLGPYFFLPREIIPSIIRSVIVPTPYSEITVEPKAAQRAAYVAIREFAKAIALEDGELLKPMTDENSQWLHIFFDHQDSWVLRPVLSSSEQIIESYVGNEFTGLITHIFSSSGLPFWRIEVSWPNLYCYQECQAGEIIIDAITKQVKILKLPGILMVEGGELYFSKNEDMPYPHAKPAKPVGAADEDLCDIQKGRN